MSTQPLDPREDIARLLDDVGQHDAARIVRALTSPHDLAESDADQKCPLHGAMVCEECARAAGWEDGFLEGRRDGIEEAARLVRERTRGMTFSDAGLADSVAALSSRPTTRPRRRTTMVDPKTSGPRTHDTVRVTFRAPVTIADTGTGQAYTVERPPIVERVASPAPNAASGTLPPEIVELLRDVASGPCTPDLRGRAGAALVRRDLVDACKRCGGSGYERIGDGSVNAWGACEGCRLAAAGAR